LQSIDAKINRQLTAWLIPITSVAPPSKLLFTNFTLHMRLFALGFALLLSFNTLAQQNYWQQEVNYNIQVSLDDQKHQLSGNETIQYTNHSPSTLNFIWFHLWPNAYKDDKTAFAQQIKKNQDAYKKFKKSKKGYIDSLNFTVDGVVAVLETDPAQIDVAKLVLPKPLAPGKTISIATKFLVQLPSFSSRSGYDDGMYMICQWYPKPAVFDHKGWHAFSYLDQGEFYSEYGQFDVAITLPIDYVVGATGTLDTKEEVEKYKRIGAANNSKTKGAAEKYFYGRIEPSKTLRYHADNVGDFAWFADKDFTILYDTTQLSNGKKIDVFSFFHQQKNTEWINSIQYIKDAVHYYGDWLGDYEYPVVSAVEGPKQLTSGGMEYPMITMITSPGASAKLLDAVITHEVGHNWFMGMLGSNERDHAWMDEGLNSFFQYRYEAEKYRFNSIFGEKVSAQLKDLEAEEFEKVVYQVIGQNMPLDGGAIETKSPDFPDKDKYGVIIYVKTAQWAFLLEDFIGKLKFAEVMMTYFNTWKFKHPYPEDFRAIVKKLSGKNLDNIFDLLNKQDKL
jgi:hypothetical protein